MLSSSAHGKRQQAMPFVRHTFTQSDDMNCNLMLKWILLQFSAESLHAILTCTKIYADGGGGDGGSGPFLPG